MCKMEADVESNMVFFSQKYHPLAIITVITSKGLICCKHKDLCGGM